MIFLFKTTGWVITILGFASIIFACAGVVKVCRAGEHHVGEPYACIGERDGRIGVSR